MSLNSVGSDQSSQNSIEYVHPSLNYMMSDSNVQMMLAARYNVVKVWEFGQGEDGLMVGGKGKSVCKDGVPL